MSTPTRDRLIKVGERFASNDILSQFNYLTDLVVRDAAGLASHGFLAAWGPAMVAKAGELKDLQDSRNLGRGGKVAKRGSEARQMADGKSWIEQATTILTNAADDPMDPKPALAEAISPFRRPVGNDAQEVATRVGSLLALFESDEWKPTLAPFLAPESDLLTAGAALSAALPVAKGAKKGAQAQAEVDTSDLDALDGFLWYLFKAAIRAGRSYWRKKKDRKRGNEYNLELLQGVPNTPKRAPSLTPPTEDKAKP